MAKGKRIFTKWMSGTTGTLPTGALADSLYLNKDTWVCEEDITIIAMNLRCAPEWECQNDHWAAAQAIISQSPQAGKDGQLMSASGFSTWNSVPAAIQFIYGEMSLNFAEPGVTMREGDTLALHLTARHAITAGVQYFSGVAEIYYVKGISA